MDNFHGHCPLSPWTKSMDSMEKIHGHFPWIHWKLSTVFVPILHPDFVHGFHGFCPWIPWILSTDSMDFLQTGRFKDVTLIEFMKGFAPDKSDTEDFI